MHFVYPQWRTPTLPPTLYLAHMITRHSRGEVTWVDLEAPSYEELESILQEFGIDPRIEQEIISPTPYPLALISPEYAYLILHFPATDPSGGTRDQEVDFIVGRDFIITARYEVIDSLHALHRVFEADELMENDCTDTVASVLELVLRRLYGAIREEMERVANNLDRIERDIFSGKERRTVRTISETGRVLLRFETVLLRHEEALDAFLTALTSPEFFGKGFKDNAAKIVAEHDHVSALVGSYRAVARELRITNDSLLTASQNDVMKTISVLAFFLAPSTLVASLFGMNVDSIPFVAHPYAFWIILCLVFAISGIAYLIFRLKKWF